MRDALLRLVPRRLHTRRLRARADVQRLSAEERQRLGRNLRAMLAP